MNSRVPIEAVCYDDELKNTLLSMGITNMTEFKNNGVCGLPEYLLEKASWTLRHFDFEPLEQNRVKLKN